MNEPLKEGTLKDYQNYIYNALDNRGFLDQDVNTRLALLTEEVGELAKAIRKFNNEKLATDSKITNLGEEIADVFFVLLSIANITNIDVSKSFYEKEIINNNRIWKK